MCVYGFMKEALTGTLHDAVLNTFLGGDRIGEEAIFLI